MKSNYKRLSPALAVAMLTIFSLVLAGCQSNASPAVTATSAATATSAPTAEATAAPTQEPIVLEGATTTDDGLQYLEEVAGNGVAPQAGELVTMNYIATLPDGTELGNTYTSGQSVTILYGKGMLLPGWEEGISLMKVGGKAKMVLPPELAYGADGYGSFIPANSQIVLEVELISTQKTPEPSAVTEDQLTASDTGLKYYDLTVGTGEEAIQGSAVSTHYTLWVKTDKGYDYIDSSVNDTPLDFTIGTLDTVFKGWDEGVTGMKVGGKRYLVIPPDLGMGDQANGIVPANSTLVMEIELTKVVLPQVMTPVNEKDYTVTATGLKYYDIVPGTGAAAEVGKTLVVNYTGWLEDGTQFDSSYTSGTPFSFQLGAGKVIAGWEEGLVGMKVGGKRQLVIPASLGYGDSAVGSIPAGSTLIFEVELMDVQDAK